MNYRLKAIRRINGYTQKDVANLLNITQRTYSKYETGELSIKISQLVILSGYYKVSIDYLLGLSSNVNSKYIGRKYDESLLVNNIKYLRYEHNYSQKQLSKLINCSPSLISMVERGESRIQVDMLVALSKLYNKSTDYLMYSKDNLL